MRPLESPAGPKRKGGEYEGRKGFAVFEYQQSITTKGPMIHSGVDLTHEY